MEAEMLERTLNNIDVRLAYMAPRLFRHDFEVDALEWSIVNDILYVRHRRWLAVDLGLVTPDRQMPDRDVKEREAWLNTEDEDEAERIDTLRETFKVEVDKRRKEEAGRYARQ